MTSSIRESISNAWEFATSAMKEKLSTTSVSVSIAAALIGVSVDVVYTVVQRRLKYEALVKMLRNGERGAAENQRSHNHHHHAAATTTSSSDDGSSSKKKTLSMIIEENEAEHQINRCEESARLSRQLSHRGVISVVLARVGTGVTSLLHGVARYRTSTTYISLAGASTLEDMCAIMKARFGLEEERLPTTFFVFSRILRGISVVLGSADGSAASEGSDTSDEDAEVAFKWTKLINQIRAAAGDAYERNIAELEAKYEKQKKRAEGAAATRKAKSNYISYDDNQSNNKAARNGDDDDNDQEDECARDTNLTTAALDSQPMLVFDDADLDEGPLMKLAQFAHSCNVGGNLRVTFVVQNPFQFFSSPKFAHAIKFIMPAPPPASDVANFIHRRCPFLKSKDVADALVAKLCGRNIGIAQMVCFKLEEELCDSERPINLMPPADVVELVYRETLRRFAFGATRPFHLYSLQSVGDAELDEQRAGLFRIAMLLLDKDDVVLDEAHQAHSMFSPAVTTMTSSSSSFSSSSAPAAAAATTTTSALSSKRCPREVHSRVTFGEVLDVCPLRVWLPILEHKRNHMPFDVVFDRVNFRAPVFRWGLLETVGAKGSATREHAIKAIEELTSK